MGGQVLQYRILCLQKRATDCLQHMLLRRLRFRPDLKPGVGTMLICGARR